MTALSHANAQVLDGESYGESNDRERVKCEGLLTI
jgi:hypothetical protein